MYVTRDGRTQKINEDTWPYWSQLGWALDLDQDGQPDSTQTGGDTPTPFAELPYETLPDPDRPAGARATIHWEGYRRGDVVELTLSGTTWTTGFGPLPEEFRPLRAKQFDVIGSHPFTGETVRVQGAVGDHGYVSMFNGIDPTDGTMFQVELMWIAANPF